MKYKIRIDNQVFNVEVKDLHTIPVVAYVDGTRVDVWLDESINHDKPIPDHPVKVKNGTTKNYPMSTSSSIPTGATSLRANAIRAPLPGVVKEVLVKQGEEIGYGQELCIIEAMKMKNTIRASRDAVIAEISVSPGQTVNHNDILIKFVE